MWGACQSVSAQCGLMEFNWNPSSGKTGCSNGLCSSRIVKCLVIFTTGRLIWKDWIYEKYRTLWLQPCRLGTHTMQGIIIWMLNFQSCLLVCVFMLWDATVISFPVENLGLVWLPYLTGWPGKFTVLSGPQCPRLWNGGRIPALEKFFVRIKWARSPKSLLPNRHRMWATYGYLSFLVVTLKAVKRNFPIERGKQFNNTFNFTQYIPSIIISGYHQYKNI